MMLLWSMTRLYVQWAACFYTRCCKDMSPLENVRVPLPGSLQIYEPREESLAVCRSPAACLGGRDNEQDKRRLLGELVKVLSGNDRRFLDRNSRVDWFRNKAARAPSMVTIDCRDT